MPEELEVRADVDDGCAGQELVAHPACRLASGVELPVAEEPRRASSLEEVVLERHEELDLVGYDRSEGEVHGLREGVQDRIAEAQAGVHRLEEGVGDLRLLGRVLDAPVVADQEHRHADALALEVGVEGPGPVGGDGAVHAQRPAANRHDLAVAGVANLLVVRGEAQHGEEGRAERRHALQHAQLRVDGGGRAVVVGGGEVVREVGRNVRGRERLDHPEAPRHRVPDRLQRRLGRTLDQERHVVVVDAGVTADALARVGGAVEADRVGRGLVVVGAEPERHVAAGGKRVQHRGPHALGLVLEQPDRHDRDDDRHLRAVPDGDGACVDRVVNPFEEMVGAARRVEPVVPAVRIGIAVRVGLVVEEAGPRLAAIVGWATRRVVVGVGFLQAEEPRPGEDRRRAIGEHRRIDRRIEGRRRHVHLGRAEEVGTLRAGRTGRQGERERGQEAHHCAAITSAMVKGIGLYSKRS